LVLPIYIWPIYRLLKLVPVLDVLHAAAAFSSSCAFLAAQKSLKRFTDAARAATDSMVEPGLPGVFPADSLRQRAFRRLRFRR
jgi:hypothetical protein